MIETPLLRVSRPVAACSRCRAAKVKCDGKLPACTACEKSNRASECSSTNDQFARGKERSYVATLESRVERLEKKISEATSRRKSSAIQMLDASDSSTPRRTSVETVKPPKPISKRAARRKEASDIDELVSDFGLLAVNATARDFYGFTTEMSYARLLQSTGTKEALPIGHIKELPPRFAATPLVQHFLNNVFTLLPIFEEAVLYASLDAIYQQRGDNATGWDKWTVRMVLAIACLSQSEQRGDAQYADAIGHVNAAMENAEEVLHPGYISSIQALVLWTIYATMDPHHFDSWTLIGAASRAMVDLGIHQDPSRNVTISRTKLEVRRRVYWCVYALDRSTSLVQTRAFSFSDEAANVSSPFHTSPSSPKYSSPQSHVFQQSFDTALDLFRIRQIQSEWYMTLFQSGREPWQDPYPYIWNQYARMTEWLQEMPQTTLPATKSFFELELLYSYVYILSPSPRIPHIHEYAQRLIFEHCIAYATNLMTILKQPLNTTKPPVTFYDAMRAYMTGRQFVEVLTRNLDVILDPRPPIPPTPVVVQPESEDPLSPPTQVSAPLFPSPVLPEGQIMPPDPLDRSLNAMNDFTTALSTLGLRFGFSHWRDRFQRESATLSAQLFQRKTSTAHTLSPSQQMSASAQFPPQWMPMPSMSPPVPPSGYQGLPTTPPAAYPQQTSPFSHSVSYNNNPFENHNHNHNHSQSPHQLTTPFPTPSQGQGVQTWTSPSTQQQQQLPDLPLPGEGQQRRAMVFGPGLPAHPPGQGHTSPNASQPQDNIAWNPNPNPATTTTSPQEGISWNSPPPPLLQTHSSGSWNQGNWT